MGRSKTDADQLNDIWDAQLTSDENVFPISDPTVAVLEALLSADAETPDPDPVFLRTLRASLFQGSPAVVRRARGRNSLGIVAQPYALSLNEQQWSKRAVVIAIAVVIAVAILSTGLTFRAGGRPAIGMPTAQASAIVVTSTPIAQVTATIKPPDR